MRDSTIWHTARGAESHLWHEVHKGELLTHETERSYGAGIALYKMCKMSVWHQWLGIVGTIFILGAYFLLQTDRLSSRDLSYSLLNAVGASFLVVSLLFDFNFSALIVESFWALISAVGIIRYSRSRSATHATFQSIASEAGDDKGHRL